MASAANSYRRILQLLERWPVDKNKSGGRDCREYLEECIKKAYKENKFESNQAHWDQQYLAIQRIVDNTNKNKYSRLLGSTASGLTAEQCNIALSNEFMQQFKEKEKGFFRKLISLKD